MFHVKYIVALTLLVGLVAGNVYAHSFYDAMCCHNRDCYPLPDTAVLEEQPNGAYYARWVNPHTGKIIEGIVAPQNVKDSQDHQLHGCETPMGTPRCLYIHRGA